MKLTGFDGGRLRLPKSFYERPLTPKEAQFATDNINIVWWYLDQQGLDRAEWFDVVIFRYLLTVKRWFALPELQEVRKPLHRGRTVKRKGEKTMTEKAKILQLISAPAGMSIVSEYADDVCEIPVIAIALMDEGGTRYLSALGMSEDGETFSSADPNFLALLFNGDRLRKKEPVEIDLSDPAALQRAYEAEDRQQFRHLYGLE